MRTFMHRAVHLVLAYMLMALSFNYLYFGNTFATSTAFDAMASIATEKTWGFIHLAFGIFGLMTWTLQDWRIRTMAAGVLSFAHAGIAALFFAGNPHAAASRTYLGYALLGAALAYSTAHLGARTKDRVDSLDFQGPLAR